MVCWISKYFLSEPLHIHSLLNNNNFTTFSQQKHFPFPKNPPPCFLKKSRSKKHFTCLISTEIYDLRKLIVMDIPRHLTEVLSLSRGDTALGEDFFFGGREISPRTFLEKGPRLLLFTCCRSERLVKVRTNSKFAFSLDVSLSFLWYQSRVSGSIRLLTSIKRVLKNDNFRAINYWEKYRFLRLENFLENSYKRNGIK